MAGTLIQHSISLVSSFSLSQHRCAGLLSVKHASALVLMRTSSDPTNLPSPKYAVFNVDSLPQEASRILVFARQPVEFEQIEAKTIEQLFLGIACFKLPSKFVGQR